jgi:hypothetical protein
MTAQDAAERAKVYLKEVLPEYANAEWHLEELETTVGKRTWLFTFSATSENKHPVDMSLEDFLRPYRVTKQVEVDSETGDLLAIRNKAA